MAASARSEARARVVTLRRPRLGAAARLVPPVRSVALGAVLATLGVAAYVGARETSAFAVRSVVVEGASPRLAHDVRNALAPLVGHSLVGLSAGDVLGPVEALPEVRSASYDRAFPHTLVIDVRQERAVAVLRAGTDAWLVSARGRVLRRVERGGARSLARVWVPAATEIVAGERVGKRVTRRAVAAAAVAKRAFARRVLTVQVAGGELTFLLADGHELRFGDGAELELKLAVAERVLREPAVRAEAGRPMYVDVSFPERVVVGGKPQVGGRD